MIQRPECLCNVRQMRHLNMLLPVTMTIISIVSTVVRAGITPLLQQLGYGDPGIDSRQCRVMLIFIASLPATGPTHCVDRGVNLNIHLHLEPGRRMSGAVPPFPRLLQGAMLG